MDHWDKQNPQENQQKAENESALADDAVPVCPNCLEPCDPLTHYCPNCDSNEVINPLASYMPYVKIRFETGLFGKLWRLCWHPQTPHCCRGFCIFLAFMYMPVFIIGLPFLFVNKIRDDNLRRVYSGLCYGFAVVVFAAFWLVQYRWVIK